MGMISCPYCNMEVSMTAVEVEDGCCPECGAMIISSSIFTEGQNDAYDEFDEGNINENREDDDIRKIDDY